MEQENVIHSTSHLKALHNTKTTGPSVKPKVMGATGRTNLKAFPDVRRKALGNISNVDRRNDIHKPKKGLTNRTDPPTISIFKEATDITKKVLGTASSKLPVKDETVWPEEDDPEDFFGKFPANDGEVLPELSCRPEGDPKTVSSESILKDEQLWSRIPHQPEVAPEIVLSALPLEDDEEEWPEIEYQPEGDPDTDDEVSWLNLSLDTLSADDVAKLYKWQPPLLDDIEPPKLSPFFEPDPTAALKLSFKVFEDCDLDLDNEPLAFVSLD